MRDINDTISATRRSAGNKGLARKLRQAGHLPAVAYGPNAAPAFLALDPKALVMQRQAFSLSHIYNVAVADEKPFKAIIKEIQRNAVTRQLLHVDLYRVDAKRPIRVEVPIELAGKPAGLIDGGLLSQVLRSVEVLCLPDAIPAKIVADVSPLKVGDSLHLSDLALPEGVKLTAHGDEAIALVAEPDVAPEPAPGSAAAAAPAAGAAATPASAAKPGDKK